MKYNIILVDPPWTYNDRKLERLDGKMTKFGIGAATRYACLTTPEIMQLPIHKLVADNCALFLWITSPFANLTEAIMYSWGFRFIKMTGFIWVKTNLNGTPFFGTGFYTKSNTEFCALGIKGKMTPVSNSVSEVIMEPHPRGENGKIIHSRKPMEVRSKIVELFGNLQRIELFATERIGGWDSTGYGVDNLDIREFLKGEF